jgi:FixJ family two-component response regulator
VPRLPLISVVDDDVSGRESLPGLLETLGFSASPFASAGDFLASASLADTACLILEVSIPGMSGPRLQAELARRGLKIPTIYITAHIDLGLRNNLLAGGAVECVFKPFSGTDLRAALDRAPTAMILPAKFALRWGLPPTGRPWFFPRFHACRRLAWSHPSSHRRIPCAFRFAS